MLNWSAASTCMKWPKNKLRNYQNKSNLNVSAPLGQIGQYCVCLCVLERPSILIAQWKLMVISVDTESDEKSMKITKMKLNANEMKSNVRIDVIYCSAHESCLISVNKLISIEEPSHNLVLAFSQTNKIVQLTQVDFQITKFSSTYIQVDRFHQPLLRWCRYAFVNIYSSLAMISFFSSI